MQKSQLFLKINTVLLVFTLLSFIACGQTSDTDRHTREYNNRIASDSPSSKTYFTRFSLGQEGITQPALQSDSISLRQIPEKSTKAPDPFGAENSEEASRKFGFSASASSVQMTIDDGIVTKANGEKVPTGFGINQPQKEVSTEISTYP